MNATRLVVLTALGLSLVGSVSTAQDRGTSIDERQILQLLGSVRARTARFEKSLGGLFGRDGVNDLRGRDEIGRSLAEFRHAIDRLRDRVDGRQSNARDAEEPLRRAIDLEGFMQRYQLSADAERNWRALRSDLDSLARAYHLAWSWNSPGYASLVPGAGYHHRLTGTYQLEDTGGDAARQAAERATRELPATERRRATERLLGRLQPPDQIAIERNGTRISMASTAGPRVGFDADGLAHAERWATDQVITRRASLDGERLLVATTGRRGTGFTVIFDPMGDARALEMTRTIDDEALRQPVTLRSVYRRVSKDARWDLGSGVGLDRRLDAAVGTSGVLAGTRLVAVLDDALNLTEARDGDVFTMTIRTPSAHAGGTIEGVVSSSAPGAADRHGVTLTLRSLRAPDGRVAPFDAVIDEILTPAGDTVGVAREGLIVQRDSQARRATERGAIGAALGAVIGALAGGGEGAAIGAVVGGAGGAGSAVVAADGRRVLPRGTEVTMTSNDTWSDAPMTGSDR
jgi:hypothetical protein